MMLITVLLMATFALGSTAPSTLERAEQAMQRGEKPMKEIDSDRGAGPLLHTAEIWTDGGARSCGLSIVIDELFFLRPVCDKGEGPHGRKCDVSIIAKMEWCGRVHHTTEKLNGEMNKDDQVNVGRLLIDLPDKACVYFKDLFHGIPKEDIKITFSVYDRDKHVIDVKYMYEDHEKLGCAVITSPPTTLVNNPMELQMDCENKQRCRKIIMMRIAVLLMAAFALSSTMPTLERVEQTMLRGEKPMEEMEIRPATTSPFHEMEIDDMINDKEMIQELSGARSCGLSIVIDELFFLRPVCDQGEGPTGRKCDVAIIAKFELFGKLVSSFFKFEKKFDVELWKNARVLRTTVLNGEMNKDDQVNVGRLLIDLPDKACGYFKKIFNGLPDEVSFRTPSLQQRPRSASDANRCHGVRVLERK